MNIGLISDTHGYLDSSILKHLENCDEIWHAGDIGTMKVMDTLKMLKPVRAVFGNIDGRALRMAYPLDQHFECEGLSVWITHIGGSPSKYPLRIVKGLKEQIPAIFICGHSHILKVMHDHQYNKMLYINPGAVGKYGIHQIRTMILFTIKNKKISNFNVVKLGTNNHYYI